AYGLVFVSWMRLIGIRRFRLVPARRLGERFGKQRERQRKQGSPAGGAGQAQPPAQYPGPFLYMSQAQAPPRGKGIARRKEHAPAIVGDRHGKKSPAIIQPYPGLPRTRMS